MVIRHPTTRLLNNSASPGTGFGKQAQPLRYGSLAMANSSRKQPPRFKQLLLGAIFLLALILWLSHKIIWEEKEIDVGQSAAARKDMFLAAKHLLQWQAVESQSLRSFILLDHLHWQGEKLGPQDTLVMTNSYKLLE